MRTFVDHGATRLALVAVLVAIFLIAACEAARTSLALSATGNHFSPIELVAPAGRPVTVTFHNATDASHTLIFLAPIGASAGGAIPPAGVGQVTLEGLAPGAYRFVCNVHEAMVGTLVVR